MVGNVVKVTGIDSDGPKLVWSSGVSIIESKESGKVTYSVRYQFQSEDNRADIDEKVQSALDTVTQQLTEQASSQG